MVTGAVRLFGSPSLVRQFTKWFTWSPFAPSARAGAARRLAS
jgi:hypothetical protein